MNFEPFIVNTNQVPSTSRVRSTSIKVPSLSPPTSRRQLMSRGSIVLLDANWEICPSQTVNLRTPRKVLGLLGSSWDSVDHLGSCARFSHVRLRVVFERQSNMCRPHWHWRFPVSSAHILGFLGVGLGKIQYLDRSCFPNTFPHTTGFYLFLFLFFFTKGIRVTLRYVSRLLVEYGVHSCVFLVFLMNVFNPRNTGDAAIWH